jgi:hypothetical protein
LAFVNQLLTGPCTALAVRTLSRSQPLGLAVVRRVCSFALYLKVIKPGWPLLDVTGWSGGDPDDRSERLAEYLG